MLAFKLAIFDQCQCILLCVRILLAKDTPFSTTSETLSYNKFDANSTIGKVTNLNIIQLAFIKKEHVLKLD